MGADVKGDAYEGLLVRDAQYTNTGAGLVGRWREYAYDERVARDEASLDIFWLRDDAPTDSDTLQPPEAIAQEIQLSDRRALMRAMIVSADCWRFGRFGRPSDMPVKV